MHFLCNKHQAEKREQTNRKQMEDKLLQHVFTQIVN